MGCLVTDSLTTLDVIDCEMLSLFSGSPNRVTSLIRSSTYHSGSSAVKSDRSLILQKSGGQMVEKDQLL